jgi:hypothetical protein
MAAWFADLLSGWITGYATKPFRVVGIGALVSLTYAVVYWRAGLPEPETHDVLQALYFSFTTFATLGYGDVTYPSTRPWLRLLSTSEGWFGAVFIALFVTVLARKMLR